MWCAAAVSGHKATTKASAGSALFFMVDGPQGPRHVFTSNAGNGEPCPRGMEGLRNLGKSAGLLVNRESMRPRERDETGDQRVEWGKSGRQQASSGRNQGREMESVHFGI